MKDNMKDSMRDSKGLLLKPLSEIKKKYDALFDSHRIDQLSTQMERLSTNMMNKNMMQDQKGKGHSQYESLTEQRFLQLNFKIENIKDSEPAQRDGKIKHFVSDVVRTVTTVGFKQLELDKLTQTKFRQFFCNNVIANICKYANFNKLKLEQLKMLDSHLQKKVLPFLKQRYPQNQSTTVNKKFESMIKLIDNFESNQNDLIYQSGVKFALNTSGDYGNEIMQFLNYLIRITKQTYTIQKSVKTTENGKQEIKIVNETVTLSQLFFKDMEQIFQKVQDPFWMVFAKSLQFEKGDHGMQNDQQSSKHIHDTNKNEKIDKNDKDIIQKEQHKQKYKKIVKQYTKYDIGQKLSQNVAQFSKKDIEEKNLKVSNAGLMRILTKWCQELKKNLEQVNINSRDERFRMADGSQRFIKKSEKRDLYLQIKDSYESIIKKFLDDVKKNIYFNMHEVVQNDKCIHTFSDFSSQFEGITGYFATFLKKSYENYLISYLNNLIHCILKAQQNFKGKFNKKDHYKIAVNLISFKIGDLLRCRCYSKEDQIIALYNYVQYYCEKNKKILEIIRVKNRLSEGTKDILINLKYREKLLVQMQLGINEATSKFIKLSDKANHFIYELERSTFGPISEMCSVYTAVDPRFNFFSKKFEALSDANARKSLKQQVSTKKTCLHKNPADHERIKHPVWCDKCSRFTASLNIKQGHNRCKQCDYIICSMCQYKLNVNTIEPGRDQIDYKKLATDPDDMLKKRISTVNLKSKIYKEDEMFIVFFNFKIMFFMLVQSQKKPKQGQKKQQKKSLENKQKDIMVKKEAQLRKETQEQSSQDEIVRKESPQKKQRPKIQFKKHPQLQNKQLKFVGEANNEDQFYQFFTNKVIKAQRFVDEEEKQILQPFLYREMLKLMISNIKKKLRKYFVFEQIKLDDTVFDDVILDTVETINFKQTQLTQMDKIIKSFPNAKILMIHKNKIKSLKGIGQLKSLQQLNIQGNELTKITRKIKKLTKLRFLVISNNKFECFPQPICDIPNLQILNFKQNKIENISPNIDKLVNLTNLRLTQNNIKQLPKSIQKLMKLKQIDLGTNKFTKIPPQIKNIKSLEELNFNFNQIQQIDDDLFEKLTNIRKISFKKKNQKTKIKKIPYSLKDKKLLQSIDFQNNQIKQIPQWIFELQMLEQIILTSNKINQLKLGKITEKSNLKILKLSNNKISSIPPEIVKIIRLQILQIGNNDLKGLSADFTSLINLRQVDLSGFNLTSMPEFISQLSNLQVLKLNKNKIKEISKNDFHEKYVQNLTQLCLSDNELNRFPVDIIACTKLQTLKLDKNQIKQLPEDIQKLTPKVYEVSLSNNKFSQFPKQILKCKNLQNVILSNNAIPKIPKQISEMQGLQKLKLAGNPIKQIPITLADMKNLIQVQIDNGAVADEQISKIIKRSNQLHHKLKRIGPSDEKKKEK